MTIQCVIMAGGVGSRFWPISTPSSPKQCLSFDGEKSLLQHTIARAKELDDCLVSVLAGPAMEQSVRQQIEHESNIQILIEPSARNTFPCFLWAVVQAKKNGCEQIVIWPSDHDISPVEQWIEHHREALRNCTEADVVVLGIEPRMPHTGYGYIEVAEAIEIGTCQSVVTFHEKPTSDVAKQYVHSGRHLWNSGVVVANVDRLLHTIIRLKPAIRSLLPALEQSSVPTDTWSSLEAISFDYAILERCSNITVVSSNVQWNDLGSWDSIQHLLITDGSHTSNGVSIQTLDSHRCTVFSTVKKRVSLLGVEDLVVVETEDELMILKRSHAQQVKLFAAMTKEEK